MARKVRESLWDRMERKWVPEPNTGCWLWFGARGPLGYGVTSFKHKPIPAHRAMWELLRGPIPEGLEIDHLCRTPECINPDHLEPVTHRVNILRGRTVAAANLAKTQCPRGHVYDDKNTYRYANGTRNCRQCDADDQAARRRERRMAPERERIACACGCGTMIIRFDDHGRERKWSVGHHNRRLDNTCGKSHPFDEKRYCIACAREWAITNGRGTGLNRCGFCGQQGHNRRRCPQR